jgi:hypothetical protein
MNIGNYMYMDPIIIVVGLLILSVRDHKGMGCNVALIKCTLGPGKPKGGWNFGREGTGGQMGNRGS